mmetsp:Transcript_22712/g.51950  ORF Transcript_22712/g.51950 Transcript_22712/m.51950 type:complete len:403 (-) Transcript_22712:96-1304(-)
MASGGVPSSLHVPIAGAGAPADGYAAVEAGSPRNEMRTLELSRHTAMPWRQKAVAAVSILVLVVMTTCGGAWFGIQMGRVAIEHQAVEQQVEAGAEAAAEAPVVQVPKSTTTPAPTVSTSSRAMVTSAAATPAAAVRKTSTTVTTATKTSTATTVTTTQTSTPTSTSTTRPYRPTLFCFSIMRHKGYELGLVRTQLAQGVSIFACDAYTVFSDVKTWLTPGPPVRIDSTILRTSLSAQPGVKEHILNTQIFLQAWTQLKEERKYEKYEWVVKVDPDAVFFPERLVKHLNRAAPNGGRSMYFLNCKFSFGLFGALEVLSRRAMDDLLGGQERCKRELPWKEYGEDLYLRKCLDLLKVERVQDFDLLSDGYCNTVPAPCVSGRAAFHPFKNVDTYLQCLKEAER